MLGAGFQLAHDGRELTAATAVKPLQHSLTQA